MKLICQKRRLQKEQILEEREKEPDGHIADWNAYSSVVEDFIKAANEDRVMAFFNDVLLTQSFKIGLTFCFIIFFTAGVVEFIENTRDGMEGRAINSDGSLPSCDDLMADYTNSSSDATDCDEIKE